MNSFKQTWKKYKHIPFLTATVAAITIYGISIFREPHTPWEIVHNLAQDTVISLLFYYLLVYVPEKRKNDRIKKSLQMAFEDFKINTIRVFMHITKKENVDLESIKKLLKPNEFKKYFADDKWQEVMNGLTHNKKLMHSVMQNLDILRKDFLFSLYNADISDNDMYYYIKDSAQSLAQFSYMEPEAEDMELLSEFLWNMFSKTSWIHNHYTE